MKKKYRVVIRQWTPRQVPYVITKEMIHTFTEAHYQEFDSVVYAGWSRRYDTNGKRKIGFYVATGNSTVEARKKFKENIDYEKKIWEIFS